ncbi:MAG TPA: hypothetical protein V6D12_06950 [Candidatus Obscuribacterales bacterium]
MKNLIIGLLTVAAIGAVSMPARSDDANIQEIDQQSIITGNENDSMQSCDQINSATDVNDPSSSGSVQRCRQVSDIMGDRNINTQQGVNRRERTREDRR